MQRKCDKAILRLLIPAMLGLMISSCATTPKIYTNQDPAADFTSYRTYARHRQERVFIVVESVSEKCGQQGNGNAGVYPGR